MISLATFLLGLNLILYVEEREYLRGITQGLGARFVIHPFKTLPFVAENGLSVATGTETFVGIKMVSKVYIFWLLALQYNDLAKL